MIVMLIVLSIIIISCYCILIFKWNAAWNKIPLAEELKTDTSIKLSVIIPVRNEAANTEQVLTSLLNQTYPSHLFEIIVTDDHSDDNTINITKEFFSKHKIVNGSAIQSNKFESSSKKQALRKAIDTATGELIVTTDADCVHDKDWLQTIASYFILRQPVMICGPVLMQGSSSFLQQFQTLDYLSLQASGAASLSLNKPLLCSGANLAFSKRAFYEVNGYDDNLQHASGDDTFLMLKMNQRFPGKVQFLKSKQSIVTTSCSFSLAEFLQQRFRWASKTKQYSSSYIKALGSFIALVNLFFLLLLFSGIYSLVLFCFAISYLLIKTLADYFFLSAASGFFKIRIKKFSFILMEVIYPVYLLALAARFLRGSYQWKKRNHHT